GGKRSDATTKTGKPEACVSAWREYRSQSARAVGFERPSRRASERQTSSGLRRTRTTTGRIPRVFTQNGRRRQFRGSFQIHTGVRYTDGKSKRARIESSRRSGEDSQPGSSRGGADQVPPSCSSSSSFS